MADEKNDQNIRDFSKVILTLDNVLLPHEKLSPTPSMADGLDEEVELDLRILGCELIQTSGILLKLPQVAMATGQVLFQRFYYSKSFVKHTMEVVAMGCVNLASKIEEAPRRMRDVINVFHHIKQVKSGRTISPLVLDQSYVNLKNQVIKAERRILKELGFCVHVKHPHKIIVMYLRSLGCENRRHLVQCAWNYMNDSFRTSVFVCYPPETIACACIYLAARHLQIVLPKSPPWYEIFGATEEEIQYICLTILRLYARPKPNGERLDHIVNDLKKVHIEARLKARGGMSSNAATPNSESRPATPSKMDSPMGSQLKKVKIEEDRKSDHSFGRDIPKKRSHSPASRDTHSRSRSRSRSRSYHSSRSRSRSPAPKKRQHSPRDRYREKLKSKYSKASKMDSYDKYESRNNKIDKYNHREKPYDRGYDDKYKRDKGYYHDSKDYKRKRAISPIVYNRNSRSNSPEVKSKKRKDRYRSRSRSRSYERERNERRKTKKHNGHRRSRSRDRY